jgi:hypothetical protein
MVADRLSSSSRQHRSSITVAKKLTRARPHELGYYPGAVAKLAKGSGKLRTDQSAVEPAHSKESTVAPLALQRGHAPFLPCKLSWALMIFMQSL